MTCVRATVLLSVAIALAVTACSPGEPPPALPYDDEFPGIDYARTEPAGTLGQAIAGIADGELALDRHSDRAWLDALLDTLAIDASSQALVFSRTALQTRYVSPATPRAIYFNDETYVAYVPDAPTLEIAGFDPALGPVFYTLPQAAGSGGAPEREFVACLRCHDTYSLSGGGVPRFLLGSGYTGTDGELVSHEAWILTGQATPLRSRWGGWYVTGRHGAQVHLGNIVVEDAGDLQDLESLRVGNIDALTGMIDVSRYPAETSDIVALMVLEHQVEVQNLISRLRYESAAGNALEPHITALADAMLMRNAIALTEPVTGSPAFAAYFESLGPFDADGRSLREFDHGTRLFRYPLSYLIYSDGFQALPDPARAAMYRELADGIERLPAGDRDAILEILAETLSEFPPPSGTPR